MRIATIGRGSVGGGLAKLSRAAGHTVTEIGARAVAQMLRHRLSRTLCVV